MKTIIAIPAASDEGLQSKISGHFGHCQQYTLVTVEDGAITETGVLPNIPHQQGGCMAPVNHLASNGVQILLAGGMGMRPLAGFNEVGIEVFKCEEGDDIQSAVDGYLQNKLPRFVVQHTCGGGVEH
ncbi:MAG: dinitrogenase iron-molybdenum cofactor biosynthesis protein [Gammaproteobacteria bacterium]|nr:MAG: dinitrogenase iron-molybdenum cofactor biosynthesis protein [Gammaproteobacteria bacterium]